MINLHKIERFISRMFFLLNDYIYYYRCYFWYKYNLVHVKNLPPTWNDRDSLLFHACFQILVDFVEKEQPWQLESNTKELYYHLKGSYGNNIDRAVNSVKAYAEIKQLYNWYKNDSRKEGDSNLESTNYEKHTEKLVRLVKLREYYWT